MKTLPTIGTKRYVVALLVLAAMPASAATTPAMVLNTGWQLQDAAKVSADGATISQVAYQPSRWYKATVPGTVLTSLVNDGVYPEPLYGENNRPNRIPESLCRTPYWYRTQFTVPQSYSGKQTWLRFDGINYTAEVWVNGHDAGSIKGAFARGVFNVTNYVTPGKASSVAVQIQPEPHPGTPSEQTLVNGTGRNGGITVQDGPSFMSTIGWDWIPGIRDRDMGIWQGVTLYATGPVVVEDPYITTDLPLPRTNSATLTVTTTIRNVTDQPQSGMLTGKAASGIAFQVPVSLSPSETKTVTLTPATTPSLHVMNPRLWWPNGYGAQNLYSLHLAFTTGKNTTSDAQDVQFGIRKITYLQPGSDTLSLAVNGVPVFCKGGDWGMDEAMKRIGHKRLDAQVRMHKLANYTMIRNWVGQSTSEELYDLCDKYGLLLWDEFFQPNPSDGPNPDDTTLYLNNVREKIVRYRNHPSIALWCARNEGLPPPIIDAGIKDLMAQLDTQRLYQPSSDSGHGVHSGGPYSWRAPREYYTYKEEFKTEIGSVSVPTLEGVHAMMPRKDWDTINDDWAEHDLLRGAQRGDQYPLLLNARYGWTNGTEDFVRKAQLMNFDAYRAMYEGRNAKLFKPETGILTWMSNPSQPSFVWQIYSHDLEPLSSLYAVQHACEPIHIQMNQDDWRVMVVNNTPQKLTDLIAKTMVYDLSGHLLYTHTDHVGADPSATTDLGAITFPKQLSSVHFVKLILTNAQGKRLSENFYWRALPDQENNFQALDTVPMVALTAQAKQRKSAGNTLIDVALRNPSRSVALLAHVQLRGSHSRQRVLPVYYSDNYVSLLPGELKLITIEAATQDLHHEQPLVMLDGFNVTVPGTSTGTGNSVLVVTNPETLRKSVPHQLNLNCGGPWDGPFGTDLYFTGGQIVISDALINTSATNAAPAMVYQTARQGASNYAIPVAPNHSYTVRLHFAENAMDHAGARQFHVEINGKRVLTDSDVFTEAGGAHKALVKDFSDIMPDANGQIHIAFIKGTVGEPIISGVQIL